MADDAQFQINLVTPERILLTGMATEVMLRTGEGDATFLAGHTPLVARSSPAWSGWSVLRATSSGSPSTAASPRSSWTCPSRARTGPRVRPAPG